MTARRQGCCLMDLSFEQWEGIRKGRMSTVLGILGMTRAGFLCVSKKHNMCIRASKTRKKEVQETIKVQIGVFLVLLPKGRWIWPPSWRDKMAG